MDTSTLLVISFAFSIAASFAAYFIGRSQVGAILTGVEQSITARISQTIPQLESLKKDLGSLHGKAIRAVRTYKERVGAEPDDDDLMHALNHPLAKGLLRGVGVDPEKLAAGDPDAMAKLQELAGGGNGSQGSVDGLFPV